MSAGTLTCRRERPSPVSHVCVCMCVCARSALSSTYCPVWYCPVLLTGREPLRGRSTRATSTRLLRRLVSGAWEMPRRLRNTPRLIDACRSLTSVGFCCCSVVEQPLFFHAIVCRPFALLVAPHFSRQPSRDSMSRERRRHSYEEGSLALTLGLVCW